MVKEKSAVTGIADLCGKIRRPCFFGCLPVDNSLIFTILNTFDGFIDIRDRFERKRLNENIYLSLPIG